MGIRTGCPASNVDIRNQKSKCGEREGSITTTFVLAWTQIFCKTRSVLPLVAVPGLDDPTGLLPGAALPAVRQRRRDFRFRQVGIFVRLAVFPLDQPVNIRLHHPLMFRGQIIQLLQFAEVRLAQFQMGNGFLHRFATPQ